MFPKNHPSIASALSNLGIIHFRKQNYDQALEYYQEALPILESAFGGVHIDIAKVLNNLASIHYIKGNQKEALKLCLRSLKIKDLILEKPHHDIGETLENLGNICCADNNEMQAADYYQQALDIYNQFLPAKTPILIQLLEKYIPLLRKLGRDKQAQELQKMLQTLKNSIN